MKIIKIFSTSLVLVLLFLQADAYGTGNSRWLLKSKNSKVSKFRQRLIRPFATMFFTGMSVCMLNACGQNGVPDKPTPKTQEVDINEIGDTNSLIYLVSYRNNLPNRLTGVANNGTHFYHEPSKVDKETKAHLSATLADKRLSPQEKIEQIKLIIDKHGTDIRLGDRTLLHAAVDGEVANAEVVRFLVESGFDVNAQSSNGFTPLHLVSDLPSAKVLIENGADIDAVQSRRTKPLAMVIMRSAYEKHMRGVEVAEELIRNDADVNHANIIGETALHAAARISNVQAVRLLLENKADPNAVDNLGSTPLDEAAKGSADVIELLLKKGADPNTATRYDGVTPLHIAARFGNVESVRLLIEYGANVNAVSRDNYVTPLDEAYDAYEHFNPNDKKHNDVVGKYDEVIKLLEEHGARRG